MPKFPALLKPIAGGFAPAIKSLSGGQSLSGFEQVVSQLSDRWMASYTFAINSDAKVLALRAFVMSMRGRGNTVDVPAFDLARAPWAVDAQGRKQTPGFVRTRALDGTAYADPADLRDTLIAAQVTADTELNSTSITVAVTTGSSPQPGHLFSIDRRLHMVVDVAGDGPYVLSIWPWIREDVSEGAAVNFATPSCEMRFASDDQGADALASLDGLRFGNVTLRFDEATPVVSVRELREDGGYELRE
jgi:hypothetical protein